MNVVVLDPKNFSKHRLHDTHTVFLCRCFEQVKGLPFNRYSWLTTHNAFARVGVMSGTGSMLLTPTSQEDSITDQLNVRYLCALLAGKRLTLRYLASNFLCKDMQRLSLP